MYTARSLFVLGALGVTAVAAQQDSMSRVININNLDDFCLYAPPNGGGVAEHEAEEVAYCTKSGYGTRVFPEGTIQGAHWVRTPHYVQVTGTGDFTKIGITAGDEGGELDPHGATGEGNPVGGVVYSNNVQMPEWMQFQSATDFCIRACFPGDRATSLCRHTYDVLGCGFNMPGNYAAGQFESCDGDDAQDIMYNYPGLSTFQQTDTSYGVAVPSPHPAPASSNCKFQATITGGSTVPANQAAAATSTSSSSRSSSSSSSSSSSATPTSTSSSSSSSSSTSTISSGTTSTTVAVQIVTSSSTSSAASVIGSQRASSQNGAAATSAAVLAPLSAALLAVVGGAMLL